MKKDTSYSFRLKKGMEVTFEELHIRHINLLIDIKNKELNNWFLKMAIINTFDDLKVCLLYTSPSPRDVSSSRMPSSA